MVRDRGNGAHSDSSEDEEEEVGGEEIDSDSDQVLGKLCLKISVMDPHHCDADPDSTYHPCADTGTGFLFDADPDSTFISDADPDLAS